ncbi:MAG: hypothetical protein K2Q18_09055 [Bdellovibrionales bacterium]|nr:hypothetical protein [Bdellovibrionales bacterium]
MKIITFFSFLFAFNAFSSEQSFNCRSLINGNANGKSYTIGKSVDFILKIDSDREDADASGTMITKNGLYNQEDQSINLAAYFTDGRKFKKQGDVVTVTSYDRNLWMCGLSNSPCRHWETLSYNTKSNFGLLEQSYSNKAAFGEATYSLSIKFGCTKI